MKKLIMIIAAIILMVGVTSRVVGQSTASNTATAELKIPISIVANNYLDFGILSGSATLGTVVLTAEATTTRSKTGGVTLLTGTTPLSAKYTVTGEGSTAYTISTLPTTTAITNGGSGTMNVTDMTVSGTLSHTLSSGSDIFYIGGTLNVKANQVAGTYTGLYDITVNY